MPTIAALDFAAYVVHASFLGDRPVFATGDGNVHLGAPPAELRAHAGTLLAAAPALDGSALLTAGDDGRVVRVSAAGEAVELAAKGRRWIDRLAAGPAGAAAFASGRTVWAIDGRGRETEIVEDTPVSALAFAPKGLRLAIARSGLVLLRYVGTTAAPHRLEWKGGHLAVTFSPDGANVVTGMQEPALHGWRLADGQNMRMSGYASKVRSLSWSARGRYLASSGAHAAILWPFHFKDGPMGKAPLQVGERAAEVTQVACHPAEELLAIGYADGAILLARFAGGEIPLRQPGGAPVSGLGWDRHGRRLAFGTEGGQAGVIDLEA